jgi:serine/threonine-protein kinase
MSSNEVSPHIEFKTGDRVNDRYAIETLIGKGGMGYVYKARDELIDETVALKFLHPNLVNAPKAGQLFIKEAQLVRRLRHDNIIAVHDIDWTNEGCLFFSMEYLEGQSLRQMLRKYRIKIGFCLYEIAVQFTYKSSRH